MDSLNFLKNKILAINLEDCMYNLHRKPRSYKIKIIAIGVYKLFSQGFCLSSKSAGAVAGSLPKIPPNKTTALRGKYGFRNHQENVRHPGENDDYVVQVV